MSINGKELVKLMFDHNVGVTTSNVHEQNRSTLILMRAINKDNSDLTTLVMASPYLEPLMLIILKFFVYQILLGLYRRPVSSTKKCRWGGNEEE